LYIYKLISSLLLADVVINLHESSECKVPSSFKDFMDTATTDSSAGAATFMVFFALVFFVFCLTAIMLLAEEYKSLSSCTEEDKGNCPISKPVPIPTVAAMVMPLVAMTLAFMEGRDLMGALHFNGALLIQFIYSLLYS
jgi:hypothetical protein